MNINSSFSAYYVNIYGVPQGSVIVPMLFIIYILPIKYIFHKYPNIHYHLYADDLQIYTPFLSDSDLIQMYMLSHNSLYLNMTKTDTIIFSRPSSPLSITHPFLLSLPTSQSINTIGFNITINLDYSPHINNMNQTVKYFLYNIRKSRYKLTFIMTKCLFHSDVLNRLIYLCLLLCNLQHVNLMYKLELFKRRAIRVLYKIKFASIVSISDIMRSLGWLKFRYICIHTQQTVRAA